MTTTPDASLPFRERLVFDPGRGEYRDGAIRYMMIRPDALMGMIAELPEAMQGPVLEAFARAIHRFGGRSARAYQTAGATDASALLRTIEATAPQLGWGVWRLEATDAGIALTVENSPFAAGAGLSSARPVCAPIRGMLTAVGELTMGAAVTVTETDCAATGTPCCRFAVSRAAPPAAAVAAPSR
jgi:predicted hydrocarbon binding protein